MNVVFNESQFHCDLNFHPMPSIDNDTTNEVEIGDTPFQNSDSNIGLEVPSTIHPHDVINDRKNTSDDDRPTEDPFGTIISFLLLKLGILI